MLEVMDYLRTNGFKTYIVTGGGQEFVRVYSQSVYDIPPELIIGCKHSNQIRISTKWYSVADEITEGVFYLQL